MMPSLRSGISYLGPPLVLLCALLPVMGQEPALVAQRVPPGNAKAPGDKDVAQGYPELKDITSSTRIQFEHRSSPEQKYIVESMSGGVALIDYDGDGWLDIYFTNAQSVEMAIKGIKSKSALYRNNHDGTFTDVTDKAGVGFPCWAMGASVGDYNNDGLPDLLVTCFGGIVLYRNNGDGTFTDVTKSAGLSGDTGWATGAAFGDYDGDGFADLFVSHYVDFHLDDMAAFGSSDSCKYMGIAVQCGPRGLKGAADNLYHNNRDGTFTDVTKKSGVEDPERRYGLTSIWSDFGNDGKLDLLVTNDAGANYLYQGDGKGKFIDVGDTFGCPDAMKHFDVFYRRMTEEHGLAQKVALEGLSRGGLYAYRWGSENAEKVGALYGDAPLCDMKSWPGGKGRGNGSPKDWDLAIEAYHFESEQQMMDFKGNPIDILAPLVAAHVPVLHVCGDQDRDAPIDENTDVLGARYTALGGSFAFILKQGCAHHPHSLKDPRPIVDFIASHCAQGREARRAKARAPQPGSLLLLAEGAW